MWVSTVVYTALHTECQPHSRNIVASRCCLWPREHRLIRLASEPEVNCRLDCGSPTADRDQSIALNLVRQRKCLRVLKASPKLPLVSVRLTAVGMYSPRHSARNGCSSAHPRLTCSPPQRAQVLGELGSQLLSCPRTLPPSGTCRTHPLAGHQRYWSPLRR